MQDLVGFYQTRAQADQVKSELIAAGYDRDAIKVYDQKGGHETGLWQDIKSAFGFADDENEGLYAEATRRGAVAVGLNVRDSKLSSDKALQIMQKNTPLDLDAQSAEWRKEGWTGGTTRAATTQATAAAATPQRATGAESIPVVEEELKVGKRAVQAGGVRIYSRVTETPVEEQVNLREERVSVDRKPVNRPLTSADAAFKDRVIEATETVEEAVVSKTARVVEEVSLRKDVDQRTETIRDTVRKQDVTVEQIETDPQYAPAREFATSFFSNQQYRGRSWDEVEPEARTSFEKSNPGQWDKFRDVIRTRYNQGTTKSKV